MSLTITLLPNGLLAFPGVSVVVPEPLPFVVQAGLPDAAELLSPSQTHIEGWLGARIDANEKNRLLTVDTEPLLAGYRKRPGSHPWIGEHVGKWLHAATLAWAYTGDPALKAKLDRVAADLIACQEPDGYLGTYVPEKRFGLYEGADWDVWSHKYNLIGLLTYYQYTGNRPALDCCRKMADLLIATFPGKKSILAAGTHVGMAPWAAPLKLELNKQTLEAQTQEQWAIVSAREWKDADRVSLSFRLDSRLVVGYFGNTDRAALAWGPFVLAYDQARNPGLPSAAAVGLVRESKELTIQPGPSLAFRGPVVGRKGDSPSQAVFVPFADAGSTGGDYRVWLRAPGVDASTASVLAEGRESRSRQGNQNGSIIDGDPSSFVVTSRGVL